jgi:hypothetical protein
MAKPKISSKFYQYALIVDGEFAVSIIYPESMEGNPSVELINAALQSNPVVVDVTGKYLPPPASGWTWDGTKFNPPKEL